MLDLEMDLLTSPCGDFSPFGGTISWDHFSKPLGGGVLGSCALAVRFTLFPALSPRPLLSSHALHGCLTCFLACRGGIQSGPVHTHQSALTCHTLMPHRACEAAMEPGSCSYVPAKTEAQEPLCWSVLCPSSCREISSLLWDICFLLVGVKSGQQLTVVCRSGY